MQSREELNTMALTIIDKAVSGHEVFFDNAINKDPKWPAIHILKAQYLERMGKGQDAITQVYERCVAHNPKHVPSLRYLAEHYRTIDPERASRFYERAVELDPEDFGARHDLALCYHTMVPPNMDKALIHMKKAVSLDPTNESYHLKLARIYEEVKDYQAAIAVYQHLLVEHGIPKCHLELADMYFFTEEWAKAEEHLRNYLLIEKNDQAYYKLGWVRFKQGKDADSIDPLSVYYSKNPRDTNTCLMLACAYLEINKPSSAEHFIHALDTSFPKNETEERSKCRVKDLWSNVSKCYGDQGKNDDQARVLHYMMDKYPEDKSLLLDMALYCKKQQQHKECLRYLEPYISQLEEPPVRLLSLAGLEALLINNNGKAEHYLKQAIATEERAVDRYNLALALHAQGKDAAEYCMSRAIALGGNYQAQYNMLFSDVPMQIDDELKQGGLGR